MTTDTQPLPTPYLRSSKPRPMGQAVIEMRQRFPARPDEQTWPATVRSRQDVLDALPVLLRNDTAPTRRACTRGAAKLLSWLETFPGEDWQARWKASGMEDVPGKHWVDTPEQWLRDHGSMRKSERPDLVAGLLALVCADVIRPGMPWMFTRQKHFLTPALERRRDPRLGEVREVLMAREVSRNLVSGSLLKIATIMASKGGTVQDIVVGDCVQAMDIQSSVQASGGSGKSLFYEVLGSMGLFPDDAPPLRSLRRMIGQRSPEQLVDRHEIQCRPVRDLLVDYLKERQPGVDYTTLEQIAQTLAGGFWRDLELHHPGIDSLRIGPEALQAWKIRFQTYIRTIRKNGRLTEVTKPRINYRQCLITIRAFYLDIGQWAIEDPARWGPWAVPSPISTAETNQRKEIKQRKARMDQRTRERLPVLPLLVKHVTERRKATTAQLEALLATPAGETFTIAGETFRRPRMSHRPTGSIKADPVDGGPRRDFAHEEHIGFWTWAAVEVLRHTGVRIEELSELSHHSITQYRLPTTGELVPLLQIAPSKTDEERLLLVSPELADVLSTIVRRVRDNTGKIPLVPSYDTHEKVWNPPMPLLFQRAFAGERVSLTRTALDKILRKALAETGITDASGQPLEYQPLDFRRIFVTDAVLNGLPPHIAQIICGHKNINTTMGYKAIYPEEAIETHRAFLARRRSLRPSEEYRTPTEREWDAFLAHFEKRKLSVGTCARAFGTPCIHEHACVRCSMLRPDPAQQPRLAEIRDNLLDRIAEAEREGWLGEIDGLRVSLAGAQDKLAQLDAEAARRTTAVDLGMSTFSQIAARTTGGPEPTA